MDIVISHDIDHLSVKEHIFRDLIVPKYISRSLLELTRKKVSLKIFFKKMGELFKKNAWNNLESLLEFDKAKGVNSTFFVALNNEKRLKYSLKDAKWAINLIKKYGFDIGLHAICYGNYKVIKKEQEAFKEISGLEKFGTRVHYLRLNQATLGNFAKAGYLFDTTILSADLGQIYEVDRMKEVPFHLMDVNLLGILVNLTPQQAKEKTIKLLNLAEKRNKRYVGILFHQIYFGEDFPNWRKWYIWLINYCLQKKYNFVNYKGLL